MAEQARILVVEDDPGIAAFMDEALRLEGYQVVTVMGLAAATQLIGNPNYLPDIVISDNRMEGTESAIATIAALLKNRRPPVALLGYSGGQLPRHEELAEIGGPDLYFRLISKPFELGELLDAIGELATHSLREEVSDGPGFQSP